MPFPTTRVIPTGWSAHHRPAMASTRNATCQITDPTRETPGQFDPNTGTTSAPVPFIVYPAPGMPGTCRVQEIDSATTAMQAGQEVTQRRYLVAIDADAAPVEPGWPVTVTACGNDPQLVGQTLYVADVQLGSERFERDLICTHNQG